MDRVATAKLMVPTTNGAPISLRKQSVDGALHRQNRAGEQRQQDPAELRDGQLAGRALLAEDDRGGAREHRESADDRHCVRRLPRHAEHAERVEAKGREHLAGDEQADRHHRAKAREQEDGGRDVDRGRDAADRMPPGHARQAAEGEEVPVAAATIRSSVPAMTTWMVVAANGLPVAFESWVLAPAWTASSPPASSDSGTNRASMT